MSDAAEGITFTANPSSTNNRCGMAYNPEHDVYYSVNGGSSSYFLDTYNGIGTLISSIAQGFDYRGAWFDAVAGQFEGNGYFNDGIFVQDLNEFGFPLGTGTVTLTGAQPAQNSVGDLDPDADEILYYDAGSIFRYSHETNALLGSYAVTGLPVVISNLNSNTVVYTGCPGNEIGLYDHVGRQLLFVDKSTGAYSGSCQLPLSAPDRSSFGMSYANGLLWLYQDLVWNSYQVIESSTGVEEEANASDISLHPNPATSMITVRGTKAPLEMQVLDLRGREVPVPMQREGDALTLDIQALPAGTYAIRMINGKGVETARFVKVQ